MWPENGTIVRLAQRRNLQNPSHTAAARDIGLLHVDRAGSQHAPEVEHVVAILAGGDVHAGGGAVAHQPQAVEVIGGDRLFEPAHAVFIGENFRLPEGLLSRVRAIGIDVQFRRRPDRLASHSHAFHIRLGVAPDLHLHPRNSLLDPA